MNTFIKSLRLTCFILLVPFITIGQQTDLHINRSIELSGNTSEEQIVIEVEAGAIELNINIRGRLTLGEVEVEIIDPSGERQGNLSMKNHVKAGDNKRETVNGRLSKNVKNPAPGQWIIRLKSVEAKGNINLNSRLLYSKTKG